MNGSLKRKLVCHCEKESFDASNPVSKRDGGKPTLNPRGLRIPGVFYLPYLFFLCFPNEVKRAFKQRGLTGSLPTFSRPDREDSSNGIPLNDTVKKDRFFASRVLLLHGKKKVGLC